MVDLLLVVMIVLAAVSGWRQGLVTSALAAVGWLSGLVVGLWLVPIVLAEFSSLPRTGTRAALVVVLSSLVLALIGAAGLGAVGRAFVRATNVRPVRLVDSGLGAVAMAAVVAVAGWALISSARPLLPANMAQQVDDSRAWQSLDDTMPDQARVAVADLNDRLAQTPFPEVFAQQEPAPVQVAPPDDAVAQSAAIRNVRDSVLKVRSAAPSCQEMSVGSGWVVSPERVVTNAHVVAGGQQVTVQSGGDGERLDASVVGYDPQLDLAILQVPGLDAQPLVRTGELTRGDDAVAAGYPEGGNYTLTAARVRNGTEATGKDIYGEQTVTRAIYSLNANVLPGDSGGPLLTTDGRVAGTVFAKSATSNDLGFALTDAATDAWLDRAASLSQPVATGSCTTERTH